MGSKVPGQRWGCLGTKFSAGKGKGPVLKPDPQLSAAGKCSLVLVSPGKAQRVMVSRRRESEAVHYYFPSKRLRHQSIPVQ